MTTTKEGIVNEGAAEIGKTAEKSAKKIVSAKESSAEKSADISSAKTVKKAE